LCGDERLHRMLLDYYTSQELGKNYDEVFCNFPSTIANAYIDRQLPKIHGIFKTDNENGEITRLVIKWPQVLVLTVIATDLLTPWDPGAKHVLFFCSKPCRVLQLQHEPYLLVLLPWNVFLLGDHTCVHAMVYGEEFILGF